MALLPILVIFALAYVFIVRPQQQRVRRQRDLVRSVGVGAEIQTIGGLVGRVVDADETHIKVEAAPGVVLTFVRAAVGQVLDAPADEDTGFGPDGADLDLTDVAGEDHEATSERRPPPWEEPPAPGAAEGGAA